MAPPRALVATVLLSSVVWVGVGALGAVAAFRAARTAPLWALLLPPGPPSSLWFGTATQVVVAALVAGMLHAAVLALVLRAVLHRADAVRVVPVWFAVVLTDVLSGGVLGAAALLGDPGTAGLQALAGGTVTQLTSAGLQGLVWGWLPALVGTRLAAGRRPRPATGSFALSAGAVVLAVVAIAVLVPGRHDAAPVAAPSPAPSITHFGWERIPPEPAPPGTAAGTCGADDVLVTVSGGDAATGHRSLGIRAVNRGTSSCTLDGYADVVFDDAEGDAMKVVVVHGGSFMTTDAGARRVRLAPGGAATAELGWDAQSAAGEQRAGRLFVSVRPGDARSASSVDLDVKDGGSVALTAWHAA